MSLHLCPNVVPIDACPSVLIIDHFSLLFKIVENPHHKLLLCNAMSLGTLPLEYPKIKQKNL